MGALVKARGALMKARGCFGESKGCFGESKGVLWGHVPQKAQNAFVYFL